MHIGSMLIVGNDPLFLRLARSLLHDKGFEVHTSADARDARAKVLTARPDLILVDMQLLGLDGFELTRGLKADPATRDIVVLALSRYSETGYEESALAAGCDGYIAKPIDVRTFGATIKQYLSSGKQDLADLPVVPNSDDGLLMRLRTLRVLIADDDSDVTTLVCGTLQKFGIECTYAHDGGAALDLAHNLLPDVLVLDVMMPELDGFGVLMALKRDERTRHIKVIMLTSCDEESDLMRGFGLGADDYVKKPFNPMELAARVTRFTTTLPAMSTVAN